MVPGSPISRHKFVEQGRKLDSVLPLHPSIPLLPEQTEQALAEAALPSAPPHVPQCLVGTLFVPDRTQRSSQIPP